VLTTAGFQSVGGDPANQWLAVVQAQEAATPLSGAGAGTFAAPRTYNQDGLLPAGVPVGSIVAQNNVIISAQYLNIDGLIQSGVQDHNLTLSSSLNNVIQTDQSDYDQKVANGCGSTPNPLYLLPNSGADNITAYYNAKTHKIEVDGTDVQGGYMLL